MGQKITLNANCNNSLILLFQKLFVPLQLHILYIKLVKNNIDE